jgi:hypothetical protein
VKVKLERTIADHDTHRRYNIYRREDGKFYVLATPADPFRATDENVSEFVCDTRQEALALCTLTRP